MASVQLALNKCSTLTDVMLLAAECALSVFQTGQCRYHIGGCDVNVDETGNILK